MIVATNELPSLAGKVAMVSGGFDPIHDGHVRYFAAAAALGYPLLCNVDSDDWVETKHAPLLEQSQRALVIDALRDVAYTHAAQTRVSEVLRQLRPKIFVKGADWASGLPEDEQAVCDEHGIEVRFLDTVTNSSSRLLEEFLTRQAARA